jgi:hypothetical protein
MTRICRAFCSWSAAEQPKEVNTKGRLCVLSKEMENKIPVVFQSRRKQKTQNFIQKATWVGEE